MGLFFDRAFATWVMQPRENPCPLNGKPQLGCATGGKNPNCINGSRLKRTQASTFSPTVPFLFLFQGAAMRFQQVMRHLGAGRTQQVMLHTERTSSARSPIPPEFSHRDYVAYLLSIDAEIEHCLMVQYLYGAYSLGGSQVPPAYRELVRDWQEVILGIAKEEMGHLMSVQNVLRLLGAPLHLERDDYPWDTPFYPFPFMLEPLTLDSLAKYVYTESPADWS
jgi:hypothetical protein